MRKVKIFLLSLLLSGCDNNMQLDPKKVWIICNKDRYTNDIIKIGLCRFKRTDGSNSEYFDDSCEKYSLGDTINHPRIVKIDTVKDYHNKDTTHIGGF